MLKKLKLLLVSLLVVPCALFNAVAEDDFDEGEYAEIEEIEEIEEVAAPVEVIPKNSDFKVAAFASSSAYQFFITSFSFS